MRKSRKPRLAVENVRERLRRLFGDRVNGHDVAIPASAVGYPAHLDLASWRCLAERVSG